MEVGPGVCPRHEPDNEEGIAADKRLGVHDLFGPLVEYQLGDVALPPSAVALQPPTSERSGIREAQAVVP